MAIDAFLKLDSIKGESLDKKHAGEIDILSWSWGMSNTGSAHMGGGSGTGKANVQDMVVTKYIDKASVPLVQALVTGTHYKTGSLVFRKAGGSQVEFYKIDLTEILVSNISLGMSNSDDKGTENVALNFKTFKLTYSAQKADGTLDGSIDFGYDLAANDKL